MTDTLKVGLVMPIAPIDGLDQHHWQEVKKIIIDALEENGTYEYDTKIVSEGDSVGLIHKRIVQGLYNSDIVICDVSCRNPNVMFELGMRLAFDKPTVIIKDDKTNFTFDAGVIEHIEYPRDLRFTKILEFKQLLANKVVGTYKDSLADPNHSPFLKSYGEFQSVKIDQTEIGASEMMFNMLTEIQNDVSQLKSRAAYQNKNEIKLVNSNLDNQIKRVLEVFLSGSEPGGSFSIKDFYKYLDLNFNSLLVKYGQIEIEKSVSRTLQNWSNNSA